VTTPADLQAGQQEGERRKEAAHALLKAHRAVRILRARRTLLNQLLNVETATADDVAESVGAALDAIDPRWCGTVPGPLARHGIIRDTGRAIKSARPEARVRRIPVWV
jgi:hypothetical protein